MMLRWIACLILTTSGCSYMRGTGGIFDKSEPQKEFKLTYNWLTGTWEPNFFSNDGTEFYADRLYGKSGPDGKEFEATNVRVPNKSLELKTEDKFTLATQWAGASQLAEAHWNGALNLAVAIAPSIVAWKEAHQQSSKDPGILRAAVDAIARQALANGIPPMAPVGP